MRSLFLNPSGFGDSSSVRGSWMPARLARLAGKVAGAKLVDARVEGCTASEMVLLARGFERIFVDSGWRCADALRAACALRKADPRVRLAAVVHADQDAPHGFEWDARVVYGDGEAARVVATFGFDTLGLTKIVAMTMTGNIASRKLLMGLGCTCRGREMRDFPARGEMREVFMFELTRAGFVARRNG